MPRRAPLKMPAEAKEGDSDRGWRLKTRYRSGIKIESGTLGDSGT